MVIVRTPLRISFFGGGTDHPTWFREHGGAVLSTSINKYVYLQMRRLPSIFSFNYRVSWRMLEEVKTVAEIQHPVVREVLGNYFKKTPPRFEIVYNADLPGRSGLGSSSAFTVALLQGLWAQYGRLISNYDLALEAMHVEQDLLKEAVGCQDQVAVSVGGLNRIDFLQNGPFRVTPLPLMNKRREELESHMMLFFTHYQRSASAVETDKLRNFAKKQANLHRMREMVDEGQNILLNPNASISEFGKLMHEGWCLKRDLSSAVSSSDIDDAYEAAMKAGASGGKLLGAGGGGFLLFMVEPERQKAVRDALPQLVQVPIKMETRGSHLAMFEQGLDAASDADFYDDQASQTAEIPQKRVFG
ncbi:MAG: kinase [Alphaproteobacteria bacterium]|nr:kinase [Alphaproteobacteria bacterium]MBV8549612.1 kinase [Alphaproteobacteria bacterium]